MDATDYAIADCRRGTEIAVKRFEAEPCREHAIIALEAASCWFDKARAFRTDLDEPMRLVKRFSEVFDDEKLGRPSDDVEKKVLALAHALYVATPSLSDYPWDMREESERKKFIELARSTLCYLDGKNGLELSMVVPIPV